MAPAKKKKTSKSAKRSKAAGLPKKTKAAAPDAPDARYLQFEAMLELAVALQGSNVGLTYEEIAHRYGVGEKTAKRRVKALREVFGEALVWETREFDNRRVFRLRHPFVSSTTEFTAAELAALAAAAEAAHQAGHDTQGQELDRLLEKARALMEAKAFAKLDSDYEVLLEAQGLAMRPGPHPDVDPVLVQKLRHAILADRRVRLLHRSGGNGPAKPQEVSPLGFLYGIRHYLVAWHQPRAKVLLYRLSRIDRVERLQEPRDEVPGGFDLADYAEQSFGVFQEEPVETLWRFSPRVADEAREYVFHPSEEKTPGEDGSLLVRIRAAGTREMAWHLFTWGPDVEVLQPARLRHEMAHMLEQALKVHSRAPKAARAVRSRAQRVRPAD
ncbi:MAG: helix-turn-helix transcriptional regulator [Myxococcota bacterium]